eukprot:7164952-Prorocentrum_lima.AAC.1
MKDDPKPSGVMVHARWRPLTSLTAPHQRAPPTKMEDRSCRPRAGGPADAIASSQSSSKEQQPK